MTNPLEEAFFEFFESQGVKFIDADTGDKVTYESGKIIRKESEKERKKDEKEYKSTVFWGNNYGCQRGLA